MAARREAVRKLQAHGLSERHALRLVGMSPSTLRYQPRDDGNTGLRERLKQLAGQHRRHGYRMLHNRLRHEGWAVNVKRTYRLYRQERLMVRVRRRKKLPVSERQPLLRPQQPNEVWSMDFVFDELASGRRIKTLTVVDDCSKEAIRIAADTSMPALYVTRILDQAKAERGLPKVIRTDNGPEFAGRTMQSWAADNGVELRFIQPGKPVQNAYIESFNSRLRDKCLRGQQQPGEDRHPPAVEEQRGQEQLSRRGCARIAPGNEKSRQRQRQEEQKELCRHRRTCRSSKRVVKRHAAPGGGDELPSHLGGACREHRHVMELPFAQVVARHDLAQLPDVEAAVHAACAQVEGNLAIAIDKHHRQRLAGSGRQRKLVAHQLFGVMGLRQHLDRLAQADDAGVARRHLLERAAPACRAARALVAVGDFARQRTECTSAVHRVAAPHHPWHATEEFRRQSHLRRCAAQVKTRVANKARICALAVLAEPERRHRQRARRSAVIDQHAHELERAVGEHWLHVVHRAVHHQYFEVAADALLQVFAQARAIEGAPRTAHQRCQSRAAPEVKAAQVFDAVIPEEPFGHARGELDRAHRTPC
jgi:putative transposase